MGKLHDLQAELKADVDHAKAAMQGGELEAVRIAMDKFHTAVADFLHRLEDEGVAPSDSDEVALLRSDVEGMKKSVEALAQHASEMHTAVTAIDDQAATAVNLPEHPEIPLVPAKE